jgi:hypothetical protein
VFVHASGFNLGLEMRRLIGVGTPRGHPGRLTAVIGFTVRGWRAITAAVNQVPMPWCDRDRPLHPTGVLVTQSRRWLEIGACTTGYER